MVIMFRSNGSTKTSCTPYCVRMMFARSDGVVSSGTGFPVTNSRGERSNVNAAERQPRSCARRTAILSSSPCPICTPSKKPRAMTVVSFIVSVSFLRQRHTLKKFRFEVSVPSLASDRARNAPSRP